MSHKPHISTILKKGAKLKAKKITSKKALALIEKTIEVQKNLPKSIRFPHH